MGVTEPRNEPETEYGVRYENADGTTWTSAFGNKKAAVAFVASHGGRSWSPRPLAVMQREVSPWVPVQPDSGDPQ